MNAYAIKPNVPFVTSRKLERTPATKENRNMVNYMDSHNFSVQIDIKTGEVRSRAIEKDGN